MSQEKYERRIKFLDISIERGTQAVPQDGQYHVLRGDGIIYSSANKNLAEAHFELLEEETRAANPDLVDPKLLLQRETTFRDVISVRGEGRNRARTQQEAKGGKGGRSGV